MRKNSIRLSFGILFDHSVRTTVRAPKKPVLAKSKVPDIRSSQAPQEVRIRGEVANPSAPDTSCWLTRNEASDLLRISAQTLANYERRGFLHPQYVYRRATNNADRRVIVYSPDELNKLRSYNRGIAVAARDPGERAARAVELFRQGKSKEDVLVAMRATFDEVNDFYSRWLDLGGADIVISPNAKEALERAIGPFQSVAELVEQIVKKVPLPIVHDNDGDNPERDGPVQLSIVHDGDNPDLDRAISDVLGKYEDGAGYGFNERDVDASVPQNDLSRIVGALEKIPQIKISMRKGDRWVTLKPETE
jgi:hypothetical protein